MINHRLRLFFIQYRYFKKFHMNQLFGYIKSLQLNNGSSNRQSFLQYIFSYTHTPVELMKFVGYWWDH